ncbi:ST3 beta-galactoside alpha-2,3-sialyltransferase 7 [Alosa alosa]|uniref:ST3 beta-galactoside alpha-2,3-sialyltransferase 7 n=1 Tax=Alosa alosa TaxID=278164 RepID=UPI00201510C9|nr:ST3 beta-galactoside alpha-2,3-sialyltransferase 7 [Alosa alosa]
MVAQKKLSVTDPEDDSEPLLPAVSHTHSLSHTHTNTHSLSHTHANTYTHTQQASRSGEARDFFISRERNLSISVVLLLGCFSALLVPAYLPSDTPLWTNDSTPSTNKALLNHSAALLEGECRRGWSRSRLGEVPYADRLNEVGVFLESGKAGPWELYPPLGLQGAEQTLKGALSMLTESGLPAQLNSSTCRRCVVVGSGGVLHGSHLGAHIDQYDIIIRMNNAPVFGFERDAGSRTSIRLLYPEGAPLLGHEYLHTSLLVLVPFKSLDLYWLASVVAHKPLSWWSRLWFWREVVENVPLPPENFRILNPDIMHRTGQVLQDYTRQPHTLVPTLGACAAVLALQVCDQVSLAGFGYDLQHPASRLHYYETLRMGAMETQVVHDVRAETQFLRQMVKAGVINDLTGAI